MSRMTTGGLASLRAPGFRELEPDHEARIGGAERQRQFGAIGAGRAAGGFRRR